MTIGQITARNVSSATAGMADRGIATAENK